MKLKEMTPKSMYCSGKGSCCPAVFKTDKGSFVLIGRKLSGNEAATELKNRIGSDEVAIEVPQELLAELK